ncbi:MAG: hypothetical protein S4CHLAM37_15690 [Chlamydiia bacterium]|nr:hypothetical protein [Chlamydiia bacterium]
MVKILITGATGYIGGLLLDRLTKKDHQLRAIARHPENLASKLTQQNVEIVQADVTEIDSLKAALEGIEVAFYLVHSMGAKTGSFEEIDRMAADNFAKVCEEKGVKKIIYLGGLSTAKGNELSLHMRSRQEVGKVLSSYKTPVIEFRSSIILGAGSLSYDLMRALVDKLPIMVTPIWVNKLVQPIHVEDVLGYLQEAILFDGGQHDVVEIGGVETVSYKNLMLEYAKQQGLKRYIFVLPVLTPALSSMWLGLVTPIYKRIGRKLIESIMSDSVVTEPNAAKAFSVKPKSYQEAIRICIENSKKELVRRWYDAVSAKGLSRTFENVTFRKEKNWITERVINAPANVVFAFIKTLGGHVGWYAEWLWKIRAALDILAGGVGFRRGRVHPTELRVGDPVDFWRVIELKENELLTLKAEMKLPGRAYLQFTLSSKDSQTDIVMKSSFDPIGILGEVYWYLMWPFHFFIFDGLLNRVKKESEKNAKTSKS